MLYSNKTHADSNSYVQIVSSSAHAENGLQNWPDVENFACKYDKKYYQVGVDLFIWFTVCEAILAGILDARDNTCDLCVTWFK